MVNVASDPTPFVGRQDELAQISSLLSDPACRLLTLVGPGGIGKTRLALEAAREVANVRFVLLQPLTSPDFIVSAIADAIGFQFYSGSDPKQQLLDFLRAKTWLLLLDNFEHLLEGAMLLSEILASAPAVRLLVTSRERLNLIEEWTLDIGGLTYPQDDADGEGYSAIELFTQHARRVKASFGLTEAQRPIVARICRLVGGMPLGIELAATWVRALSCEEIADEIERSLDILATPMRNMEPRHRTMRLTLAYSWALLTDHERTVFKSLSIFRGGFRKEPARAVAEASLPTLSMLVDKSMLRVDANGRYDIHELLRQYGEEQVNTAPDVREQVRDRHSAYYAEFMARQLSTLYGPQRSMALAELEAEIDNLRAAWRCMVEKQKAAEIQQSASNLADYLGWHHQFREGLDLFRQAAEALRPFSSEKESGIAYGLVLALLARFHNDISAPEKAKALAEESLAIQRRFGDKNALLEALSSLGGARGFLGQHEDNVLLVEEGFKIALETGNPGWISTFLSWRAFLMGGHGFHAEAERMYLESLAIIEQIGDPLGIADSYLNLGGLALQREDYTDAKWRYGQALHLYQGIGHLWGIASSHMGLAEAATAVKDFAGARRNFSLELDVDLRVGSPRWQTDTLVKVARLLVAQAEKESGVEVFTLVRLHPTAVRRNVDRAEQGLSNLQAQLTPEAFAAAVDRGSARDLEATVKEIIAEFSEPEQAAQPARDQTGRDKLSKRELEILRLVAEGLSNGEIAVELSLARTTIKWYLRQIFSKLDVTSRTQAVTRARTLGLLP